MPVKHVMRCMQQQHKYGGIFGDDLESTLETLESYSRIFQLTPSDMAISLRTILKDEVLEFVNTIYPKNWITKYPYSSFENSSWGWNRNVD